MIHQPVILPVPRALRPSACGCGSANDAFTLVEMLVVLVVIGLLASSVVVSLNGRDADHALRVAGEDLSTTVRYAAEQAKLSGRIYRVSFSEDKRLYHVEVESAQSLSGFIAAEGATGRRRQLPEQVALSFPESSRGGSGSATAAPAITFEPNGSGFSGIFQLSLDDERTLTIQVMAETGQVHVLR